jgi:glycerophosphoryl diester phosphodiesterase
VSFEIVAHRGVLDQAPENTIQAFERAIELGADAVEFDVRLTADQVPVVYHYFYLEKITDLQGPIFNYTWEQLQVAHFVDAGGVPLEGFRISTLREVIEALGGRIGFEIEVKGPEPEAAEIIGGVLCEYKHLWDSVEVTSFETSLLVGIQECCPGLVTDLLFPLTQDWMRLDVVAYLAAHQARLARARAVHLHPTQLTPEVVASIREHGVEVHAWDVDDEEALQAIVALGVPKFSTDDLRRAVAFRDQR